MFAITFTFNACSDSSSEDPTPPAVSSSGGGKSSPSGISSSDGLSSGGGSSSGTSGADELGCGEWEVTTAATCVAEGVETRTCTGSNPRTETRAIPIDPDEHDWEILSGTPATCSATGYGEEKCKRCGKSVIGELPIDSHAHNWGSWASKTPAMCTEKEVKERVCSHNAQHTEDEEVGEILAWNAWAVTTPTTCTAAGVETRTCPGNASTPETRPLTQLAWSAWTVTTPATCTAAGVETRTCPGNASTAQTRPLYPKCNGVEYDPTDGKFQDCRDNKFYKYVDINGQVWMAENLNFVVDGSKCGSVLSGTGTLSDANTAACDKYGRLYNWATAMNIPQSCNSQLVTACGAQIQPKHQGVCPSGWHLPSNAEWDKLMRYVDGSSGTSGPYDSPTAGKYLKATSGWYTGSGYIAGTDDYGFSALPGGYGSSGGNFSSAGNDGFWWSSSEYNGSIAYLRYMFYSYEFADWDTYDKSYLFSVRCLQD
jgi:uncharacterized protein (TIGR02145 family)